MHKAQLVASEVMHRGTLPITTPSPTSCAEWQPLGTRAFPQIARIADLAI
ncbi:hypothetical protein [Mycolicibacterium sp. A43C]